MTLCVTLLLSLYLETYNEYRKKFSSSITARLQALPTGIVGRAGLAESYEGTVRYRGLPTERPEAFASAGVSWCR